MFPVVVNQVIIQQGSGATSHVSQQGMTENA